MNNDRFKFRTPWYLGDQFAGFQYWEFEHGQVKLIGDYIVKDINLPKIIKL